MSTTDHLLTLPGGAILGRGEAPTGRALLDEIRAKLPPGGDIEEGRIFAWTAQVSSDRLDSFWTRMDSSSLQNYAQDLASGTPFMMSHDILTLPLGVSVAGEYHRGSPSSGSPATVAGTFYCLLGTRVGDVDTDHFASQVRAAIIRDVSVGFKPGHFRCSLCDGDPFDFWAGRCVHIPGVKYEGGKVSGDGERAYAWVMDGHLREVSAVYMGATPQAQISGVLDLSRQKAARLLDAGELPRTAEPVLTRMLGAPPAADAYRIVYNRERLDLHTFRTGGF